MPGENIQDWSTTAATNATADTSINWAEGQARASVNNSARSMMAAHAKDRNLKNGSITTAGTANAQTFTSGVTYTAVPTGLTVKLKVGVTNTGATTLNMDGIGAVAIKDQAGADIGANALTLGQYADLLYNGTNWILLRQAGAVPFDALAYNGMQINGSFEVDQANAGASVSIPTGSVSRADLMDGYYIVKDGTSTLTAQQVASSFFNFNKELKLTVGTAQASIGSNIVDIRAPIEGYRIARLGWGTALAQPLTVGFWVRASVAGSMSIFAANSTLTTMASATVPVTTSNAYVTATFSAQTTGTWLTDNGVGIQIILRVAAAGSINIVATSGNTFDMTGLVVLPGSDVPTAARSSLIMRPFDQEMILCRRYLWRRNLVSAPTYVGSLQAFTATLAAGQLFGLHPDMRIAPVVTVSNLTHFGVYTAGGGGPNVAVALNFGSGVDCVWLNTSTFSGMTAGQATPFIAGNPGAWIQMDARL